MATYSEDSAALDSARDQLVQAIAKAKLGRAQIAQANTTIAGLGAQYAATVTSINSRATASPDDAAAQALKAKLDAISGDFTAMTDTGLTTSVASLAGRVTGYGPS